MNYYAAVERLEGSGETKYVVIVGELSEDGTAPVLEYIDDPKHPVTIFTRTTITPRFDIQAILPKDWDAIEDWLINGVTPEMTESRGVTTSDEMYP